MKAHKKQPQHTNCTLLLKGRRTSEEQKWVTVFWRRRFIAVICNYLL